MMAGCSIKLFHATQTFRQGEQVDRLEEGSRGVEATGQRRGDHATTGTHLLLRWRVEGGRPVPDTPRARLLDVLRAWWPVS